MKIILFRILPILILFSTCWQPLTAQEKKVALKSGETYELRSIMHLNGGVVPASADKQALVHTTDATQNKGKWCITKEDDGFYSIRHAVSGQYMTYDGQRSAHRRYMRLTNTDHGANSRWKIYPGSTHIIVASASPKQQNFLLNVRRNSLIVGLYRNSTTTATDNERFVLIDKKGRMVNEIEGKSIVNLIPTEPQTGCMNVGKEVSSLQISNNDLNFNIDGRKPVYNEQNKTYLYVLPEKKIGKNVTLRVTPSDNTEEHCSVDGKITDAKHRATFDLSTPNRTYIISLQKEGVVQVAKLTFTYLPIIEINVGNMSHKSFVGGSLVVHDAETSNDSTYKALLRWRGEYTASFPKRSIGIKLVGRDGKKINKNLCGLRNDNYWILDAMTIDGARMRNRVAMDLWYDFAARPKDNQQSNKAIFASRGRLVEVFLNGKYHGVYNLCERIDRKQLQLPKPKDGSVRGSLYKAESWGTWTLMGLQPGKQEVAKMSPPVYDNRSENWVGWVAKYPEVGKKNTEWKPLYEAIKMVATADKAEFSTNVNKYFDLPVVRDYYLFIELLLATDNTGKNIYWAVLDQTQAAKLFPIPWDLDGSLGQKWNGSRSGEEAEQNYRRYLQAHQQQTGLFERLYKENPNNWCEKMAERYRTLRQSYFSPDQLRKRFQHYLQLMEQSGAASRECSRWNAVNGSRINMAEEVTFIDNWLMKRITFLDRQYGYQ